MGRPENPKVAAADGAYALAKAFARQRGVPRTVTLDSINRQFRLKKRQLHNYRANHYSRFWSPPEHDAFRPRVGAKYLPLDLWDSTKP